MHKIPIQESTAKFVFSDVVSLWSIKMCLKCSFNFGKSESILKFLHCSYSSSNFYQNDLLLFTYSFKSLVNDVILGVMCWWPVWCCESKIPIQSITYGVYQQNMEVTGLREFHVALAGNRCKWMCIQQCCFSVFLGKALTVSKMKWCILVPLMNNSQLNKLVQILLKYVKICQSYWLKFRGTFYGPQSTAYMLLNQPCSLDSQVMIKLIQIKYQTFMHQVLCEIVNWTTQLKN